MKLVLTATIGGERIVLNHNDIESNSALGVNVKRMVEARDIYKEARNDVATQLFSVLQFNYASSLLRK